MRENSASECALRFCLRHAEALGARTRMFSTSDLALPLFAPLYECPRSPSALQLVEDLRSAHGVIVSSPCYHGSFSGLIKNALDYANDLLDDEPPLLEGRAVGLIACAFGPQGTATTLIALRSIVHALRAWPTPLSVPVNTLKTKFEPGGMPTDAEVAHDLETLAQQVVEFAQLRALRDLAVRSATMRVSA